MGPHPRKINLISCGPLAHVSDIKLIRTDTTLDLSQKAEKGMNITVPMGLILYGSSSCVFVFSFDVVHTKPANIKDVRGPTIDERARARDRQQWQASSTSLLQFSSLDQEPRSLSLSLSLSLFPCPPLSTYLTQFKVLLVLFIHFSFTSLIFQLKLKGWFLMFPQYIKLRVPV